MVIIKPNGEILVIQVKRTKVLDTTKAERTTDYRRFYCKRSVKGIEPLQGFSDAYLSCQKDFKPISGRVRRIVVYDGARDDSYEWKMEDDVELISRWTTPGFFSDVGLDCWKQLENI